MELLRAKMQRDYPAPPMRRDAHPKHHACVRARFTVDDGLPSELAHGLFAQPTTFRAWVRFSNQSGTPQADRFGDIRGVAIKLLGVPGPKLLAGSEQATTHDLILITTDRFVTRDVEEFHDLIAATVRGRVWLLLFLLFHPRVARNLLQSLQAVDSVLSITYTSPTPYRLGPLAVRYRLRPVSACPGGSTDRANPDGLRQRLFDDLKAADAEFDFMVQVQTDARLMPIEDPGIRWPESVSPFRKVGRLSIPRQDGDVEALATLAEDISFNPWRCLESHRPLGGINRARRNIYASLSAYRHAFNRARLSEPEVERLFDDAKG